MSTNKVQPHNIFKATEIDSNMSGWIVDLSPKGIINPDCYWKFKTKAQAQQFANLINDGVSVTIALRQITLDRGVNS